MDLVSQKEVYKKDNKVAKEFITKRKDNMPRTMLRYAIERFPEKERKSIPLIKLTQI